MEIIKVSIKTLRMNGNAPTSITTLGYYKKSSRAEKEAKDAIIMNYTKYGSKEHPTIDEHGRKDYLITNEAVFEKIEVKE